MADLTPARRKRMSPNAFALPGRRFPVNDPNHARLALAMVGRSQAKGNISAEEAARVRAAARRKLDG